MCVAFTGDCTMRNRLEPKAIHELCPTAVFNWSQDVGIWLWESVDLKPTEAEIQAKIAELTAAEPMRELRQKRNQLLQQSDWMANSDVTMGEEWRVYRQSLRDITTQTPSLDSDGNLTGVNWPTPPTD
jgi:hypothetical protein